MSSDRGEKGATVEQVYGAEKELLDAVEQKLKQEPNLQYHEALKLVASERPDLNQRYTREMRRKMTGRE
jgi:hypothetical protein